MTVRETEIYGILSGSLSQATNSSVGQYIKFFILKGAK